MDSSPATSASNIPATGLRLDFCGQDAATYAVKRWYYRSEMPRGKLVRIGVWEDQKFRGAIIFGMGASSDLGTRWGLSPFECCEMVRLALGEHVTSTSRIVSIAMRMLKKQSPGIKTVVSFSDPSAGHVGTIYQAMNWIFTGTTAPDKKFITATGAEHHSRNVSPTGFKLRKGVRCPCPKPADCRVVKVPGKFRYVYPLDETMRTKLEAFRKPYPKK